MEILQEDFLEIQMEADLPYVTQRRKRDRKFRKMGLAGSVIDSGSGLMPTTVLVGDEIIEGCNNRLGNSDVSLEVEAQSVLKVGPEEEAEIILQVRHQVGLFNSP